MALSCLVRILRYCEERNPLLVIGYNFVDQSVSVDGPAVLVVAS